MKKIILIIVLSLLISLVIAPLRGGYFDIGPLQGFKLSSIVALLVYFLFTLYWLYNTRGQIKPILIVVYTILGYSIIRLPLHIIYFESTTVSLLEYGMHILPVLGAYFFFRIKKYRWGFLILFFFLGVWLSTVGHDYWLHKLNHDTFTGIQPAKEIQEQIIFQDNNGEEFHLSDFKGKFIIIDFWYTYCGICYTKFPYFQEVYNRYKTSEKIVVVAIHARMEDREENVSTGTTILTEEGYTFPCYSMDIEDSILKEIGVSVYPTVVIFDTEGRLVFRGNIEKADKYLKKLFK